jgi:O-antigen ligase
MALATICIVGVLTDHRHLAGIAVLTAILLLAQRGLEQDWKLQYRLRRSGQRIWFLPELRVISRKGHPKTISVLAGVTLLLAALSGAFIQAAEADFLGPRSGGQVKQFQGSPWSILVNIRPEPFQEFYLFWLRPLFGWGSHPRLDSAAYRGSKDFLQHLGVVRDDLDNLWLKLELPGVSAHSQAMDSWARAGLAAVPFWLLVLGLALWIGTKAIRFRSSPMVVLWTILILWDAIFSPLTSLSHLELAAYLALGITSLGHPPGSDGGHD